MTADTPAGRFDIVAYDIATGIVTGLLAFNERYPDAFAMIETLHPRLLKERGAEIVTSGTVTKGQEVPTRLYAHLRHYRRNPMQYANPHERRAACVCIVCENPNLKTRDRCPECAAEHSAKANIASRGDERPPTQ